MTSTTLSLRPTPLLFLKVGQSLERTMPIKIFKNEVLFLKFGTKIVYNRKKFSKYGRPTHKGSKYFPKNFAKI
jgi:hypothetical protein